MIIAEVSWTNKQAANYGFVILRRDTGRVAMAKSAYNAIRRHFGLNHLDDFNLNNILINPNTYRIFDRDGVTLIDMAARREITKHEYMAMLEKTTRKLNVVGDTDKIDIQYIVDDNYDVDIIDAFIGIVHWNGYQYSRFIRMAVMDVEVYVDNLKNKTLSELKCEIDSYFYKESTI